MPETESHPRRFCRGYLALDPTDGTVQRGHQASHQWYAALADLMISSTLLQKASPNGNALYLMSTPQGWPGPDPHGMTILSVVLRRGHEAIQEWYAAPPEIGWQPFIQCCDDGLGIVPGREMYEQDVLVLELVGMLHDILYVHVAHFLQKACIQSVWHAFDDIVSYILAALPDAGPQVMYRALCKEAACCNGTRPVKWCQTFASNPLSW